MGGGNAKRRSAVVAAAAALAAALTSGSAEAQLDSLTSENLTVVSLPGPSSFLAPHLEACAENALQFHRRLYGYTPAEPPTFFLEDFSDFGHGGANTVPTNFVDLGIAPFSYVYDTIPAIDRMFWMANHELAHVATMDAAADRDLVFRRLFGGKVAPIADHPESILYNYWTSPRWNAPRWYHEGIAVFLETWMSGGLGRALGAYDEMAFRTLVLEGAPLYDVVGLESEGTTVDFQVGVNSYLYGTRFMSYLADHYGPEKLIEWTARRPGSAAYFATQFERVYGVPLDEAWRSWIEFETEWQRANLQAIGRYPLTEFRPLGGPLGSVSRAFFDARRNKIYVAVRYPGQIASLASIDRASGAVSRLTDIRGAALFYVSSLAYDRQGDRLFFTTDNYGWREVYSYDLSTGATRHLLHDERIGDLAFDAADRSLWGVRHYNGISTLVRMAEPWTSWEQVHSWPYGQDVYDIDVSPDGKHLSASLAEVDGSQSLILLDVETLRAGTFEPRTLYDFEVASPANFAFSPDGGSLYGSSYYSGVSNVYRYDLDAADIFLESNADTGFFRPVPLGSGELLVFRYTSRGLVPGLIADQALDRAGAIQFLGNRIAERHPVVREWRVPPPSTFDPQSRGVVEGKYSPLGRLRFDSVYPIVQGYKDQVAGGVHLGFSDPLNLTGLELDVALSGAQAELADAEQVHAAASFHFWNWKLEATHNRADFYDLFGPTKRSRRGTSLGVEYGRALFHDEPNVWRADAELVGWTGLDTLPEAQNVPSGVERLLDGRGRLRYKRVEKSLGSVEDEETGTRFELEGGARYADSDLFPYVEADFAHGWLLALDHSSVWLRAAVGAAGGDRDEPFASFYFGGFGNNYVDHLAEKRYRDTHRFPGFEIDEIAGRRYAKLAAEWTLPPLRFRSAGRPGFYLNWLRTALFAGGLRTDFDSGSMARSYYDLGVQLDLRLVVFSNLKSTLSLGYARGWRDGSGADSDEYMISLKVL